MYMSVLCRFQNSHFSVKRLRKVLDVTLQKQNFPVKRSEQFQRLFYMTMNKSI